jgi:phosphate butyryltransferase
MTPIRSLEQLVTQLQGQPSRRVAVAAGHDPNTIQACARAAAEDIAEVILVGDEARIADLCTEFGLDPGIFTVIAAADEAAAGAEAVRLVRAGEADVLMKGLIGTDKYMRLILDKERGLLPPKAVLSHVTVLDIPAYRASQDKLLIVSDVAIIPDPDLATKLKIVQYVIDAAHAFGIAEPKVALIAATEKVNPKMQACVDAALITQMNRRGQITGAIVDGPLALDVACSPEACAIKGLVSPVDGSADCLVFPNIETGNVFYKATTVLGGARLAAAVVGTTAPCVLTSRADSEESKFLSIALGCRLAVASR